MTTTNMDQLSIGEIVLIKFPFTDGGNHKKRPALVLQDTRDNDVIVCRITSKIYETKYDLYLEDWKECGLKLPSVIRIHKIATLEKGLIEKVIGKTPKKQIQKVIEIFGKIVV